MNSSGSPFAAPRHVVRSLRDRRPSRTTSENWGRPGGFYGDDDGTTSGYETALLYVRRGLGRPEIIKPVIKFILEVQREYSARWTLVPMSFGWGDQLKHMGTDIVMHCSMFADEILAPLCKVAGDVVTPGEAIVPVLFPGTDLRSLYGGKVKATERDMLVFVDLAGGPKLADDVTTTAKMRRQSAIVIVNETLDAATWTSGLEAPS